MNEKKAKAIRRYVRSTGLTNADFPLHHYNGNKKMVAANDLTSILGGIITARYKDRSFQRAYSLAKRHLRSVRVAVINARAEQNFAAA